MVHILRGYAVCFNDVEALCGEDTLFRPDAFMQSVQWPVGLRFGSHHAKDLASTINGTLSLFQDDYGLGFEARLEFGQQTCRGPSFLSDYRSWPRIGIAATQWRAAMTASWFDAVLPLRLEQSRPRCLQSHRRLSPCSTPSTTLLAGKLFLLCPCIRPGSMAGLTTRKGLTHR